ncbi:Uu.00g063010.m01.CDS01 [Anthostomella pinea]|uniref:Uu.00g063010.m01.CDS01 n=1 Tax=Anthostomella pinea TaxID=933095 RepID=A0AAI8VMQ0_9PEZI|nr:Uu.00g063010.m01.CDS01 [Anthostomella pinea]
MNSYSYSYDIDTMLTQNNYPSRHHQPRHHQYYTQPQQQQQQQQQQQRQHLDFDLDPSTTSLSALDNIPAAAAAIAASQRYRAPTHSQTQPAERGSSQSQSQSLSQVPDLMPSDTWMLHSSQQTQQTPRGRRYGHQRESSLSSLGSNGPASPYNTNTSNPQIAVTDSGGEVFHDMGGAGGGTNYSYGLGKPLPMADNFYASAMANFDASNGLTGHEAATSSNMRLADGLPSPSAHQQRRRGLAPAAELSLAGSSTTSRPVSVASSTAGGDSPVTPPYNEPEDDGRRSKNGEASLLYQHPDSYLRAWCDAAFASNNNVPPKLDRTMTDVYNDELYNPNFTITSASPPPQTRMVMSPSNEIFAERLQAANSQHLSAAQSPVSMTSRDRSPFRQDSPYASALDDFPKVGMNQVRLGSAQHMREKRKAEQDASELQRQMARNAQQHQQQATPSTISPKDALIDFNETDSNSNFPLFPPQETADTYGMVEQADGSSNNENIKRAPSQQPSPSFQSMASNFNFSMPANVQVPQQYPFITRRQQHQSPASASNLSNLSRMSSGEASASDCANASSQKPGRTAADGGTYTCTYHGCTRRFETPALLQKHKREGHRQANALNHIRALSAVSPTTPTMTADGSVLNSQAGPHRCDRINPSTGKPCGQVFSRPYDLTRHEDTIHNARKQKVRCDLCTEEKSFSRADALTRHYRVCHPDVEFPGKHRRRGVAA